MMTVLALGTCVLGTAPFFLRCSSLRLEQPMVLSNSRCSSAPCRRSPVCSWSGGTTCVASADGPSARLAARSSRAVHSASRAVAGSASCAAASATCSSAAHEAAALAPRHDAARHRRHEHDAALRWHAQLVERRGPAVRCLEPLDQLGELKLGGQVDAAEAQLLEHPARTARCALWKDELRLEDRRELV